ncbi:MAG TPA: crossover junction endodeoxyribonuclease RuvC [Polyangia bacterium]|jgi:crossover junction endodeoxyribonuclease RuvC
MAGRQAGRRPGWPDSTGATARRILGIDPGTLRLGYGVIETVGAADVRYVECGIISAPARMPRGERLVEIARGLRELLVEVQPHAVAMEEAFFGKNIQSTLALGEARGVAILVAGEAKLTVVGYTPATIKKNVVGHGRATKDQIAYLVRTTLRMRRVPSSDAADALAIAICHARQRGVGGLL